MNWQRQANWMGQPFPPYNQTQFPNQMLLANGYNGWNWQVNQLMSFVPNAVSHSRNQFYGRVPQPPMTASAPSYTRPAQPVQQPPTTPAQQQTKKNRKLRKRGLQRASISAGDQEEEGSPEKKRREMDGSAKHTKFMSMSAMSPELSYDDKLSLVIWNNYTENRQTDRTYNKKQMIRQKLCAMMESLGRNCVHIVGSTMNGFGSEKSDCDMCLHISSNEDAVTKRMTQTILFAVQRAMQATRLFSDVQYIPARVPILKFRERHSGIECDLNVNNTAGLLNTRLMALYANFDWRVRPLAMFVKHWGRLCDIHDASRGRLSSYSFNLMVVQYLQGGCKPPVLPSLQKDYKHLFAKSGSVHVLDASMGDLKAVISHWRSSNSENTMSLGQLFIGFIAFFTHQIDFSKHALSVRVGRPIPMHVAVHQMPDDEVVRMARTKNSSKMFIEEPFTRLNASRSPYDDTVFAIFLRAFQKTHRMLKLRKDITAVGPV